MLLALVGATSASAAQSPVLLGTSHAFAVLASSGVTNTGPSVINGDLGSSPNPSITGFPPGIVNGTIHAADAVAAQARADLKVAYNDAAGRGPASTVATQLGGQNLTPGVYDSASGTFQITGALTLNAQGNPNAVFIFKMASTLVTASSSDITLVNGAQACNIFWQVGSSATLGTNSNMKGSILALTDITVTTGATLHGRALARNGAVTLDTNKITRSTCKTPTPPTPTPTPTPTPNPTPTPGPGAGPIQAPPVVVTSGSSTQGGFTPAGTGSCPAAPIRLYISPTRVVVGHTVRFVLRAVSYSGGVRQVLSGVAVYFNGRRVFTNRFGVGTVLTRFSRAGVKLAYATGTCSNAGARVVMRATARTVAVRPPPPPRPPPRPHFTG